MAIGPAPTSFHVLHDARPEDTTLPAFVVSTTRGFLPRAEPVTRLPAEFDAVESLLSRMSIKTASGEPGLLAHGTFGETLLQELPDLTDAVDKYKENQFILTALYRDYCFMASAYLLEPCHQRFMKGEGYGLGRARLPSVVALPLVKVSALIGFKPFMEYAGSYALFNYRLADPAQGLHYDNLRLIRAFERGMDPKSSEAGFIFVHIDMVKHSGGLIEGAETCLDAAASNDRKAFDAGLQKFLDSMVEINGVMEGMWNKSKPKDYTQFRTFIFGITSQSMFPNGVVYEGVSEEPMTFRGESGANDSMIPLADNLLQIAMPPTPLTAILQDFRSYRPGNHLQFLEYVSQRSRDLHLVEYARKERSSLLLYIHILNQIRDFRYRHWCLTREFILKQTKHATATGGSPIVTWLPNQLLTVLDTMIAAYDAYTPSANESTVAAEPLGRTCATLIENARRQRDGLRKEVERWIEIRGAEGAEGAEGQAK